MRIVRARQISQAFFFVLFFWLCVVSTLGEAWRQLRGWPVNWLLQLDPLVALATVLTTRTLYAGLAWSLVTLGMTIVLGRFFCGWVCPFGSLHHFVGFLAARRKKVSERVERNRYRAGQLIKYGVLCFLLGAAAGDWLIRPPWIEPGPVGIVWGLFLLFLLAVLYLSAREVTTTGTGRTTRKQWRGFAWVGVWVVLGLLFSGRSLPGASLQTGLLDPIPLFQRSINLVLLPILDGESGVLATAQRYTPGGWLIAAVFTAAVLLNLLVPRFYCRFVCPLGALFGVLVRNTLWRIGKIWEGCSQCQLCDSRCEGGCEPSGVIRWNECILCFNCMDGCPDGLVTYQTCRSRAGESQASDLSRRAVLVTIFSGVASVPAMRLGGVLGPNWPAGVVRPPGSLPEIELLKRCIKCGQCMRICPTNVIEPAGFEAGAEGLWTPVLTFWGGTSGCQYNCVACGHLCPTSAIRALTLEEKHGEGAFASAGPVRLGTAFVDRGRCLPWAMDKPCIVCQENCPVSPKAIFTREIFTAVRNGTRKVRAVEDHRVHLEEGGLIPGEAATGDYFLRVTGQDETVRYPIVENGESHLQLARGPSPNPHPRPGGEVSILIRLKQPWVDPRRCIGCGICEHECPVSGLRAIRVTAENESRNRQRRMLL